MQISPWIKNAIRIIAFLLVLLLAVLLTGHYLMPHSNRYLSGYTAGGILGENFDTIDVLVMGDSNAAQGISPMEWYTQNGVTGYTYGSGWLSVYNIYYRLKSIYEEQSPKVVVLCTDTVYSKKGNETYLQSAIGDIADELLPLLRFHDNWKELTLSNLLEQHDYSWRDLNKGYTPITDVAACMNTTYMYDDGSGSEYIPMEVRFYMDRIVRLCEEHGSALVLVTMPATSWNHARHLGILEYAEEYDLPYIDYNLTDWEPGIEWKTDTPDGGSHLNVLGARKVTAALGSYLMANYDLPDHRGEAGYEEWDADALTYTQNMQELVAKNQENADYQLSVLGESVQN